MNKQLIRKKKGKREGKKQENEKEKKVTMRRRTKPRDAKN